MYDTVEKVLLPKLSKDFPNIVFVLERKLDKKQIAKNAGAKQWKPESQAPYTCNILHAMRADH